MEGRTKATREGTKSERVDLRGNVETRRQEGLRATGDESADEDSEAEPINRGKPQGRQKKEGGYRRRGGGDATWGGHAEPKGGLETSKGVVQGCSQPCVAARLRYARADHGGAVRPIQLRIIPWREHPGNSKTSGGG